VSFDSKDVHEETKKKELIDIKEQLQASEKKLKEVQSLYEQDLMKALESGTHSNLKRKG
jgi:hypothetical protein